jgi:hypothetical protein
MIVFDGKTRSVDIIDRRDTMYPSYGFMVRSSFEVIERQKIGWATLMGYSMCEASIKIGEKVHWLTKDQYFSFPIKDKDVAIDAFDGNVFGVFRLGFLGHNLIGSVDTMLPGKLSYIDGCSDSLLVYPPRLGDSSLNYLHFPQNIVQSYHTHPSIRIGCVIKGSGISDTTHPIELKEGMIFCLDEHELHRFKTSDYEMKIIAFHPDGDWGPTDENHIMLNRTYVKR